MQKQDRGRGAALGSSALSLEGIWAMVFSIPGGPRRQFGERWVPTNSTPLLQPRCATDQLRTTTEKSTQPSLTLNRRGSASPTPVPNAHRRSQLCKTLSRGVAAPCKAAPRRGVETRRTTPTPPPASHTPCAARPVLTGCFRCSDPLPCRRATNPARTGRERETSATLHRATTSRPECIQPV